MMVKLFSGFICVMLFWVTSSEQVFARVNLSPRPPPIVEVGINISSQLMNVKVKGWPYGLWRISTARPGYSTPRGVYSAQRTAAVYYSKKYDNAPMPYSVFFKGGYAIHGTDQVRLLGRPASHGCVRLTVENAQRLYSLVQQFGAKRTRITVTD